MIILPVIASVFVGLAAIAVTAAVYFALLPSFTGVIIANAQEGQILTNGNSLQSPPLTNGNETLTNNTFIAPQPLEPRFPEQEAITEGNETERIMLEYKNPNMGIVVSYPENWDIDSLPFEQERAVAFLSPQGEDVYVEEVDLYVNTPNTFPYYTSAGMSLDEIAEQLVSPILGIRTMTFSIFLQSQGK